MQDRIADVSRRVVERADVRVEAGVAGRIMLHRARYGVARSKLAAVLRLPTETTVKLDGLGSEAWNLIDGRRTVADILAALRAAHPDQADIPERLSRFLSALASRQMIRLL